jgi:hypothetical protein
MTHLLINFDIEIGERISYKTWKTDEVLKEQIIPKSISGSVLPNWSKKSAYCPIFRLYSASYFMNNAFLYVEKFSEWVYKNESLVPTPLVFCYYHTIVYHCTQYWVLLSQFISTYPGDFSSPNFPNLFPCLLFGIVCFIVLLSGFFLLFYLFSYFLLRIVCFVVF